MGQFFWSFMGGMAGFLTAYAFSWIRLWQRERAQQKRIETLSAKIIEAARAAELERPLVPNGPRASGTN